MQKKKILEEYKRGTGNAIVTTEKNSPAIFTACNEPAGMVAWKDCQEATTAR